MKRIIITLCAVSLFLNAGVKAEETKAVPVGAVHDQRLSAGVQETQTATLEDNENETPKKKKSAKKSKKHKKAKKVG